jgi:molybdopterin-guanine dinucleotide biosynthesis protein B
MGIPLITVIGKSGCGKTTLLEKLVAELKQRGYKLATVKHHSHRGFDIDQPGKDSWRFAQAGSDHVIIAAPDKIASYRKIERELTLDEIAATISDVDLILVEGYRQAEKPSIEVVRAANCQDLIGSPGKRFALVADFQFELDVPQFDLDDVQGIANLIEQRFLKGS